MYHLNKQNANLLEKMLERGITKLIFDSNDLSKFTNYVIPTIKDNVTIADDIDNIVIVKKPIAKLYFDITANSIICNLKLLYKDKEIDYFTNTKNIVRDTNYEEEVIMDLSKEHFIIEDKKIILDLLRN